MLYGLDCANCLADKHLLKAIMFLDSHNDGLHGQYTFNPTWLCLFHDNWLIK